MLLSAGVVLLADGDATHRPKPPASRTPNRSTAARVVRQHLNAD